MKSDPLIVPASFAATISDRTHAQIVTQLVACCTMSTTAPSPYLRHGTRFLAASTSTVRERSTFQPFPYEILLVFSDF